jgi:predicted PurR-regulated permease PerM
MLDRVKQWIPLSQTQNVELFLSEVDHLLGPVHQGTTECDGLHGHFLQQCLKNSGFEFGTSHWNFYGLGHFHPYIGIGFGLLLALMSSLLEFEATHALSVVAIVFGAGQMIEGFFLTPKLVGERIGLHPVVVIFALLTFGQLFGFCGGDVGPAHVCCLECCGFLVQEGLPSQSSLPW